MSSFVAVSVTDGVGEGDADGVGEGDVEADGVADADGEAAELDDADEPHAARTPISAMPPIPAQIFLVFMIAPRNFGLAGLVASLR